MGVLVFVVPISLYSLMTQGSLSYSGQSYLYAVYKDSDVLRNGYGRPLPTPREFILANLDFIPMAMLENARDYATMLFLEREWLRPLLPAGFGVALALRWYPRRALIPATLALASFATYAMTWANFQERYQLPTLLLLLPFLADGLARLATLLVGGLARLGLVRPATTAVLTWAPLFAAVLVVGWFWYPTWRQQYHDEFRYGDEATKPRVDDNLRWTGPPRWSEDNELARVDEWLLANTNRDDPVTHGQPWPYTFFTMRPAALLPTKLTTDRLRAFITDYRIALRPARPAGPRPPRLSHRPGSVGTRGRDGDDARQLPHLRYPSALASVAGRENVQDSAGRLACVSSSRVWLAVSPAKITTLATDANSAQANGSIAAVWPPPSTRRFPRISGAVIEPRRETPAAQPAAVPRMLVGYSSEAQASATGQAASAPADSRRRRSPPVAMSGRRRRSALRRRQLRATRSSAGGDRSDRWHRPRRGWPGSSRSRRSAELERLGGAQALQHDGQHVDRPREDRVHGATRWSRARTSAARATRSRSCQAAAQARLARGRPAACPAAHTTP